LSGRQRVLEIADELRAVANLGLNYALREGRTYDHERYERVLRLSAELLALADSRDADEIQRLYSGNLDHVSPKVTADAALFDASGRIFLAQRFDDHLWCIPGGGVNVGETAAEGAAREMLEECGLVVRPKDLIGVFDNRRIGMQPPPPVHAYHFLFACEYTAGVPTLSDETLDLGYFAEDGLPTLTPGHAVKVDIAFRHHVGLLPRTHFDVG
jgi:ADP-ribose pyrophosphatase YjhB (NUDIX family)